MKKNLLFGVLGIAMILFAFTSCQKAPQVEIDAARAAVENATAMEANRYLTEEFNVVQDSLNAVLALVETQNSKFALFRNYKDAKAGLESVTVMADQLTEDVVAKKEEVKMAVEQSLTEVNNLIAETKGLIIKAPKGKEGKAALDAIQNDLTNVETSVGEVNAIMESGDYLTAQDKVNAAKETLLGLKAELESAIAKVKK